MSKKRIIEATLLCIVTVVVLWGPFVLGDYMLNTGWNMDIYCWPLGLTSLIGFIGIIATWFKWIENLEHDKNRQGKR